MAKVTHPVAKADKRVFHIGCIYKHHESGATVICTRLKERHWEGLDLSTCTTVVMLCRENWSHCESTLLESKEPV